MSGQVRREETVGIGSIIEQCKDVHMSTDNYSNLSIIPPCQGQLAEKEKEIKNVILKQTAHEARGQTEEHSTR